MDPYQFQEQMVSAQTTTKLVGRESQLSEIDHAVREGNGVWLIEITGRGGIGKTRLVSEILRRYQNSRAVIAAHVPVDLYHAHTHSVEGLMGAICAAVDPDRQGFVTYRQAQEELDRYLIEPSGQAKRLTKLRETVGTSFLSDLKALAAGRRLILAMDTAEKLVYEITEVEEKLGLTHERLAIWTWLRDEFLPAIENAVVLLAGRPQLASLTKDVTTRKGFRAKPLSLPGFSTEESVAYFEAVAQDSIAQGRPEIARRIRSLPEEWRRAIADLAGGRPILLALVVDYLVVQPVLPHDLLRMDSESLEMELVRAIQETGRSADEVVRALSWARKGMDAALLARVADRKGADGSWDLTWAQAALDQVRDLSFVKVRPSDQRVFLHDEMYDLMERHVLQPEDYPAEAERVYGAILRYYQEQIDTLQEELLAEYRGLSEVDSPADAWRRVGELSVRRQAALVENQHYQLQSDAQRGFDLYYRYAEEAALGENQSLDAELRAELLSFLEQRVPTGQEPIVAGLARAAVNADGAIRWIKRRVADEKYRDAVRLADLISKEELLNPGDALSENELRVWKVLAQLYGGSSSPDESAAGLGMAVEELERLPRSWRRDAVLARAYNNLGYARRNQGLYLGAIDAYKKAIPLWRRLKIEAEQANTLNNLAFALAEVGDFDIASRQAKDALDLRRKLGSRPQIGLSLSTLAQIAIREGMFITARSYAERAHTLFEATGDTRGLGMAQMGLAEAKRRFGAEGLVTADDADQLLNEAVEHAEAARAAFSTANEPAREIEALIELGCGWRDSLKLRRRHHSEGSFVQDAAKSSRDAFQAAAQLAKAKKVLHLRLDAIINEAWLEYYLEAYIRWMASLPDPKAGTQAGKRSEELLAQASKLLPNSYRVTKSGGVPPLDPRRVVVPVLSRMGKLQLLLGQRAFNEFEDHHHEADLRKAIEFYTLSLTYDYLVSDALFRDKRRAQDRMYERMRKLNSTEWRAVFGTIQSMEKKFKLGRSNMRDFLQDNFGSEEDLTATD